MNMRLAGRIILVGLFVTCNLLFAQTTNKKSEPSVKDRQWKPEDFVSAARRE